MEYPAFKIEYPVGSSINKPFPPYDFWGECVSYILRKIVEVDGVPINAPIGHAAQIPFNTTFLKYYEKIPTAERKPGDLMFWGNDAGNWTGEAGHAALYNGGNTMLNQNYNGSRVISINTIFNQGFIGYYRKKEVDVFEKPTTEQIKKGFASIDEVPTNAELKDYGSKDWWYFMSKIIFQGQKRYRALKDEKNILQDKYNALVKQKTPVITDEAVLAYITKRLGEK